MVKKFNVQNWAPSHFGPIKGDGHLLLSNSLFSPKIKTKQVEMTIGVLFAMKYVFLHFRYTCLECGPNGSQTVVNVCVQGCVAKYEFE